MVKKRIISLALSITLISTFSIKASAWTPNSNPNKGNELPDKVYDTSAASSGGLTIDLSSETADDKKSATITVEVAQKNKYEVRYAEIPTLKYTLDGTKVDAEGTASTTLKSGTSLSVDASGTLSGTADATVSGNLGGLNEDDSVKLSGMTVKGYVEAWHSSGGSWTFTYYDGGIQESFVLTDYEIPTYFTGTYKNFSKSLTIEKDLPTDVYRYIYNNGLPYIEVTATPLSGSVVPGSVSAQIVGGKRIQVTYKPRMQYTTNDWWKGSNVEQYFYSKVNMPKVRPGYGYNSLSILDGGYAIKLTQALMDVIYKAANGTAKFNTSGTIAVDSWGKTTIMNIKDIYSGATLWGGGNMGVVFESPIDITFTPLKRVDGIHPITGLADGTLRGSAYKTVIVKEVQEDGTVKEVEQTLYKSISTTYSGYATLATDIDASIKDSFSTSVDVDASYVGTTNKAYTFDGWSSQEVTQYILNATPGTTYKKPFVIPVVTTIELPDGTKVTGNYAEFNVTKNGTYKVTATDGKSITESKTITIDDIGQSKIDIEKYTVKTTSNATDVNNITTKLITEKLEVDNKVKAFNLTDTTVSRVPGYYVFFLRVKDSISSSNIINGVYNGMLYNSTENELITDTLAKKIYDPTLSEKDRLALSDVSNILQLKNGIYVSTVDNLGYRVLMVKFNAPDITEHNRIFNLTIKSNTGSYREEAIELELDSNSYNYLAADFNYKISANKSYTAIYTRDKQLKVNNIARIFNADKVNFKSTVTDPNNVKSIIPNEIYDIVDNNATVTKTFSLGDAYIKYNSSLMFPSYSVETQIDNVVTQAQPNIVDSKQVVYVVYEPIDSLLDTSSLNVTKLDTGLNIKFIPANKNMARVLAHFSQMNIKTSDIKIALVNYGTIQDNTILNAIDYPTEDAMLNASIYTLGSNININTSTSNDVRLLYGVPGVFVDSVTLDQGLTVSIPNVSDNTATILDISPTKPFTVNIMVEYGDYKYNLPADFNKMISDKKIRSLIINNKECISLSKSELERTLNITSEGTYPIDVAVTNIFGTVRTAFKTATIIDSNIVANGARLDNDSSVVITKDGLYDLKTSKFTKYTIPNTETTDNGYSIKGIRLTNNNVVLIDTSSSKAQILDKNLNTLKTLNLAFTAIDLVEYRDKVYFAAGSNGLYSMSSTSYSSNPTSVSEVPSPIYSLETYGSLLITGSSGDKALRTYQLTSNKLNIVDSLSSKDIYGQDGLQVSNITIRNGRLELYPDKNYHIIIDLP